MLSRLQNPLKNHESGSQQLRIVRDILDEEYGCVTVRGRRIHISPELINKLLGISIDATMPKVVD